MLAQRKMGKKGKKSGRGPRGQNVQGPVPASAAKELASQHNGMVVPGMVSVKSANKLLANQDLRTSCFEMRQVEGRGVGIVATRDIPKGIIFAELSFSCFAKSQMISSPEIDLQAEKAVERHHAKSYLLGLGAPQPEPPQFPPSFFPSGSRGDLMGSVQGLQMILQGIIATGPLMDVIANLNISSALKNESAALLENIFTLEDSHQTIPVEGSVVQWLANGRLGIVTRVHPDNHCTVKFSDDDYEADISPNNLKFAGGVYRTNGFGTPNDAHALFKLLCRFNHSCQANCENHLVDFHSDDGSLHALALVRAKQVIKKGEELTLGYLGDAQRTLLPKTNVRLRRDLLKAKYNFECECDLCREQLPVIISDRRDIH